MNLFTIVRIVAILFGAVTAAHLARSGFDLLLDDALKAIIDKADDFLKVVLVVIDPAIQGALRSLRDWGFVVPDLLDHWRQVFVLMLLFFGAYVRETVRKDEPVRSFFLGGWAVSTALVSSVAAGTVNFEDVQLFVWPVWGFFVFFLGVRVWDVFFNDAADISKAHRFGLSGVLFFAGFFAFSLLGSETVPLQEVRDLNLRIVDAIPSPSMFALLMLVLLAGGSLCIMGFPSSAQGTQLFFDNPGRGIGLNILLTFAAATAGIALSRAEREAELPDPSLAPEMVLITPGKELASRMPQRGYWLSKTEVTNRQFRTFVETEKYQVKGDCNQLTTEKEGSVRYGKYGSWRSPQFKDGRSSSPNEYGDSHPVICVSLADARAYARWLSDRTGQMYRLPTRDEWVNAADQQNDDLPPEEFCELGNLNDPCLDDWTYTAPVAQFPGNSRGLHDMVGNVWEWTETCADTSDGQPAPWHWSLSGGCAGHSIMGSSWDGNPWAARFFSDKESTRTWALSTWRKHDLGFRVVRD
jgi:formylglycine-generating enzyme required for sulfatase activity